MEEFVKATRHSVESLCDASRFANIGSYLKDELGKNDKISVNIFPIWGIERCCETVSLSDQHSIIYDQSLTESLFVLNGILLEEDSERLAMLKCCNLICKNLFEQYLSLQNYVSALYFYKHCVNFSKYLPRYDYVFEPEKYTDNHLHTIYQEAYIIIREYMNFVSAADSTKSNCKNLDNDFNVYFASTLWMRKQPSFTEYGRYAILPTIILYRHLMAFQLIDVYTASIRNVWDALISSDGQTEMNNLVAHFNATFTNMIKSSNYIDKISLISSKRKFLIDHLLEICGLFPDGEQYILTDGFLPLMTKYKELVDEQLPKVTEFLMQHMVGLGAAMKNRDGEAFAMLEEMSLEDSRLSAMLATSRN
jgi:hypothetical protein